MSLIMRSLPSARVNLNLPVLEPAAAVNSVLALFRGDPSVADIDALDAAVKARNADPLPGCPIMIAHGRTNSVRSLVIAAGRMTADESAPSPLRLVFVVGIPSAMNAEYLRAVGAIARACGTLSTLEGLLQAPTSGEFIERLAEAEKRL